MRIFICEKVQYLAATPDGIVECDCCGAGVLELKCPYCLSSLQSDLEDVPYLRDGHLIQEHDYFYQVQTQLMCMKLKYGDFFVWSPRVQEGVYHLERMSLKVNVCETILQGSYTFFLESVIPELSGMYYTSRGDVSDAQNDYCYYIARYKNLLLLSQSY